MIFTRKIWHIDLQYVSDTRMLACNSQPASVLYLLGLAEHYNMSRKF